MGTRLNRSNSIDPDLYLVVDATADYTFWQAHLTRHFPRARKVVHSLDSKDPVEQFDRIVEDAQEGEYSHVVFLTDEDAAPDPAIRVKRLRKKVKELDKRDPTMACRVKVFGVRRCLESWLLADEEAIRRAFPRLRYHCKTMTDISTKPKSAVKALYDKAHGRHTAWSEIEFAGRMACRVDFARASKWSKSLRDFWVEMRGIFNKWR